MHKFKRMVQISAGITMASCFGLWAGTDVWAMPVTHQRVPKMQDILLAAKSAHLTKVFVPAHADLAHQVESVECDDNQVFTIDFPKLVLREAMHPLTIDGPSGQLNIGQVGESQVTVWQSFLLPDDGMQHVMSLNMHGMYVLLIPKSLDAPNDLNQLSAMTHLVKTLKMVPVTT